MYLQSTNEKAVRKQLEADLGVDLGGRKAFIRELVLRFLNGKLKPPKGARQPSAAKQPLGRVIVVGAGPAGLAAACHLKACIVFPSLPPSC